MAYKISKIEFDQDVDWEVGDYPGGAYEILRKLTETPDELWKQVFYNSWADQISPTWPCAIQGDTLRIHIQSPDDAAPAKKLAKESLRKANEEIDKIKANTEMAEEQARKIKEESERKREKDKEEIRKRLKG